MILKLLDPRVGKLKRLHYTILAIIVLGLVEGTSLPYALHFGTPFLVSLAFCLTLYLHFLLDCKRFRDAGATPYNALIGSILYIAKFTYITGTLAKAFLKHPEEPSKILDNLAFFSFLIPIAETIPFMGLWLFGLIYIGFLLFTPSDRWKAKQQKNADYMANPRIEYEEATEMKGRQ